MILGGHQQQPQSTSTDLKTIFSLDVGVGENVNSMEEAITAGKNLSTDPTGTHITTLITGQSYRDLIDISPSTNRLFWSNMGLTGVRNGSVHSSTLTSSDITTLIPPAGTLHTPKQLTNDHANSHL